MSAHCVHRRDVGLTLVELVVVTGLLGLVATVIAATFSIVIRSSPATQFRIDDARTVRSLQTWLARDVASTPPAIMDDSADLAIGGYIFSDQSTAWLPAGSTCGAGPGNIIHMAWNDAGTSYHANYRIEAGRVVRTLCSTTGTEAMRLGGDVATDFCSLAAFAGSSVFSYPVMTSGDVTSVEICLRSTNSGDGLAGSITQQDIVVSVSSRNYVEATP